MAYANANNSVNFVGTLVRDPDISSVGKGKNAFNKAVITLAVPKLYKKDRGKDEDTADFPRIEFVGDNLVDFIENHFEKGKAASVQATFRTFNYEKDGETIYGSSFDGVAIQFVPGAFSKNDEDDEDEKTSKRSKKKTGNKKKSKKKVVEEEEEDDDDFEIDDDDDFDEDDIPF